MSGLVEFLLAASFSAMRATARNASHHSHLVLWVKTTRVINAPFRPALRDDATGATRPHRPPTMNSEDGRTA